MKAPSWESPADSPWSPSSPQSLTPPNCEALKWLSSATWFGVVCYEARENWLTNADNECEPWGPSEDLVGMRGCDKGQYCPSLIELLPSEEHLRGFLISSTSGPKKAWKVSERHGIRHAQEPEQRFLSKPRAWQQRGEEQEIRSQVGPRHRSGKTGSAGTAQPSCP